MCGIAGVVGFASGLQAGDDWVKTARQAVRTMCDRQLRRGPDGEGFWSSPCQRVHFGHRRLAIIDLSPRGAQPMSLREGDVTITFNGEIYNYRELRAVLQADGEVFDSDSDTEVILRLYLREGRACLRRLRGMFALALWDGREAGLLLARDGFGIKPLYYARQGEKLYFASQVKALLAGYDGPLTADPAGQAGFLLWGCVPEPFTLFQEVSQLPTGHSLWLDAQGQADLQPYVSLADLMTAEQSTQASLTDLVANTVEAHLVADTPVGVFLSAGIDSTVLASHASQITARQGGPALQSFTLGFELYRDTPLDEVPWAEKLAQQFGTSHRSVYISREDFESALPEVMGAMDQPSTDGVNAFFISKYAVKSGLKVCLSGLGGDEIFGGYPSFQQIPRLVNRIGGLPGNRSLGRILRSLSLPWLGRLTSPKWAGLLEYGGTRSEAFMLRRALYMPWELAGILGPRQASAGLERLASRARLDDLQSDVERDHLAVSLLELGHYTRNQLLRDSDWASMANSLELRVPFLDTYFLQGLSAQLNSSHPPSKQDLALATPQPLPEALRNRPKTGFVFPVAEWFRESCLSQTGGTGKSPQRGLRDWAVFLLQAFGRVDLKDAA